MQTTQAAAASPKRRRYRWLWISLTVFLLLLIAGFIYAAWPGRSTFTVSPETTYVTGPLDKDGYVDYVAAVNERLRGKIKPEENANVLLWQAIGPHPEGGTMPEEYWQWLGAPQPPENGEYFISYDRLLRQRKEKGEIDAEKHQELTDRMMKACAWPWRAQDEPELGEWLKQVEKPLSVVVEATKRPEYFNALVPKPDKDGSPGLLIGALIPSVQACRGIGTALACRAMLHVKEEKIEDAWQDLLACHRLARLVGRNGDLIQLLVGIALETIADQGDAVFLEHAHLTSMEIPKLWLDLQALPPLPPVAQMLDLNSRFTYLDVLMYFAREWPGVDAATGSRPGGSKKRGSRQKLFTRNVNWDPAFRDGNRWFDRIVACARMTDRAARQRESDLIAADINAIKKPLGLELAIKEKFMGPKQRGEMVGDILLPLLLPGFDKILSARDRVDQLQHNLHIAFALAAYHADRGRYPVALAELAPKYLGNIPDDIFSGKPLIYKPQANGYLLYSVGANGIDDGGRSTDDGPPGDDLVIRMPVPEPKVKK